MTGRLIVVGTPLGNLGDCSPRVRESLVSADVIACEDTRRTGKLLELIDARGAKMVVVNDHTEEAATPALVGRALDGATVALVTDAGMPAVSDPGAGLVAAMADAGVPITVVPGPSAVSTAVAGSGLPAARFVFEGFLPRKGVDRSTRLREIADERRAVVFYESPHRMVKTIADLLGVCDGDRRIAIGRELTKLHEEWYRGRLADATEWLGSEPRGEFVVVVAAAPAVVVEVTDDAIGDALGVLLDRGMSTRDAVAEVMDRYALPKRRVYDIANARP